MTYSCICIIEHHSSLLQLSYKVSVASLCGKWNPQSNALSVQCTVIEHLYHNLIVLASLRNGDYSQPS